MSLPERVKNKMKEETLRCEQTEEDTEASYEVTRSDGIGRWQI